MIDRPALLCALALLGALSVHALAQAVPTATRAVSAEAGAGISIASPDYGTRYIKGISASISAPKQIFTWSATLRRPTSAKTPTWWAHATFTGAST